MFSLVDPHGKADEQERIPLEHGATVDSGSRDFSTTTL